MMAALGVVGSSAAGASASASASASFPSTYKVTFEGYGSGTGTTSLPGGCGYKVHVEWSANWKAQWDQVPWVSGSSYTNIAGWVLFAAVTLQEGMFLACGNKEERPDNCKAGYTADHVPGLPNTELTTIPSGGSLDFFLVATGTQLRQVSGPDDCPAFDWAGAAKTQFTLKARPGYSSVVLPFKGSFKDTTCPFEGMTCIEDVAWSGKVVISPSSLR